MKIQCSACEFMKPILTPQQVAEGKSPTHLICDRMYLLVKLKDNHGCHSGERKGYK